MLFHPLSSLSSKDNFGEVCFQRFCAVDILTSLSVSWKNSARQNNIIDAEKSASPLLPISLFHPSFISIFSSHCQGFLMQKAETPSIPCLFPRLWEVKSAWIKTGDWILNQQCLEDGNEILRHCFPLCDVFFFSRDF